MVLTLLDGLYPDNIGRRVAIVGNGTVNLTTYTNTVGDTVTLNNPRIYIDVLFGGFSTDGTFYAVAGPAGSGVRQTWKLYYYTAAGAQVTTASQVNGKIFQLGGFGGSF